MTRLTITALLLCSIFQSYSQKNPLLIDSLKRNLAHSTSNKDKIFWMGELVFAYNDFDTMSAQQYAEEQSRLAEATRNRQFIMDAIFTQFYAINLKVNASPAKINQAIQLAEQAMGIAKESNNDAYQAWSNLAFANCYFARENTKSIAYATSSVDIASNLENDSLSVYSFLSLGDAQMDNGNKIACFRNYLKALNVATGSASPMLKIAVSMRLADFYLNLKQWEKSKDHLINALEESRLAHNRFWECTFLHSLGRVYIDQDNLKLAEDYLNRALGLADSIRFDTYRPNIYFSLLYLYHQKKEFGKYLQLIHDHPEIDESFSFASGNEALDGLYRKAVKFKETEQFDSAVYYYRQVDKLIAGSNTSILYKNRIYLDFGGSLIQVGDFKDALAAYQNAAQFSDRSNPIEEKGMARWFDTIYRRLGDYPAAYRYKVRFDVLKDSLDKLSKEDELLMKEIDNETQRNEKIKIAAEAKTRRWHNIQYMGITISIILVFTLLVMLGIFSFSVRSIEALGFFAFLLLFEFIILIADNFIHRLTHGEPWKVLLIKIGIAAILLPLHHYVEKEVIHYFSTRKKHKLKNLSLFRRSEKKEGDA